MQDDGGNGSHISVSIAIFSCAGVNILPEMAMGSSSAAGLNVRKMLRNPCVRTCHVARDRANTQVRNCWYHNMINTIVVREWDRDRKGKSYQVYRCGERLTGADALKRLTC